MSLPGWWRFNQSLTSDECHPLRTSAVRAINEETDTGGCPVYKPCEPPESCPGDNLCLRGYDGPRCSQCLEGQFHRVNGRCVKCPDRPWLQYALIGVGAMFAAGFGYMLRSKGIIDVSILAIVGIDYLQVLAIFASTRVEWPRLLEDVLAIMSAFNLNINVLFVPECIAPGIGFEVKFLATLALPVLVSVVFMSVVLFRYLYKLTCTNYKARPAGYLCSDANATVSAFIVLARFAYLFVTMMALTPAACLQTTPPDGQTYMDGMTEHPCWEKGGLQPKLFPVGLIAFGVFSIGLPVWCYLFLRRNAAAVKEDQILRAAGVGNDSGSSNNVPFRERFYQLYFMMKPGKITWQLVITARKFFIAFVSLVVRTSPSYQLALVLLVLFSAYVMHLNHMPYMTRSNKPEVIKEHLDKVRGGDKSHVRIQEKLELIAQRQLKNNTGKRSAGMGYKVAQE